jgi:hypothetical protein
MEANPSLEFDHFLAQKLGMTVARLRAEMGNDEYVWWNVYYGRQAQRDELAMKSARGAGVGGEPGEPGGGDEVSDG